jgi:hypothetical protein
VCAEDGLEMDINCGLEGKKRERERAERGDDTNRAVHCVVCLDDVHSIPCPIG